MKLSKDVYFIYLSLLNIYNSSMYLWIMIAGICTNLMWYSWVIGDMDLYHFFLIFSNNVFKNTTLHLWVKVGGMFSKNVKWLSGVKFKILWVYEFIEIILIKLKIIKLNNSKIIHMGYLLVMSWISSETESLI